MNCRRSRIFLVSLASVAVLGACSQENTADPVAAPVTGANSFLLFPNPQQQPDGTLQTDSTAYATAYYEAIDPNNERDTLAKFMAKNGFGSGTGNEVTVVFGDVRDLGYGRRMTARQNVDGTVAVMVENYLASSVADYTYSKLNVEAAVARDDRWHVGTNGIEYTPGPAGGASFAKFYTFSPKTGERLLAANLDGRGAKAMPGICINCHGGRADPLTPATGSPTGKPLFPLVGYAFSQARGDVQAKLHMLDVDAFDFSTVAGFTRADQEAALKAVNKMVLCTYPIVTPTAFPEDSCRRTADWKEWQGTSADVLKQAYGGDGLPNATFSDTYVPTGWSSFGQTALYNNVVKNSCRTCHMQRGTPNEYDIDFTNYCFENLPGSCYVDSYYAPTGYYFASYGDRMKAHVIDRGNMPLAKIINERFWSSGAAESLAAFLDTAQNEPVRDASGAVLKPGRPIADAGPDRTTTSPATLSGANSLYADSYAWSIASGNGTLANAASSVATLNAASGNTVVVQLVVSRGGVQSAPSFVTVTIDNTLNPPPFATHFSDVKAILQGSLTGCAGCHVPGGGPPIFYNDIDRNGDGMIDATDDLWFYTELRGRINFTDIKASPLLRKPTNHHHAGGLVFDAANTTACQPAPIYPSCQPYATLGEYYAAKYNTIVNWVLNGAPY